MGITKMVLHTLPIKLQADISKSLAVGHDGNVAAAGGSCMGLMSTNGYANEMSSVEVLGFSIGISGAAVSDGDELEVGTGGQLITRTTGTLVGRAKSTTTGAGQDLSVLLLQN